MEPSSQCISPATAKSSAKWAASPPAMAAATVFGGSAKSRYFRLTLHEANSPEGAIINELKLRILNEDRMPIGQLERAALAGPSDLDPQALLGRQVYWTALGEFDQAEQALFDEFGNLEPRRGLPAHGGEALVEYKIANRSGITQKGALVIAVRPAQINPYWQHGGHAVINAITVDGRQVRVNDRSYAAFSSEPESVAVTEFDEGDVIRLIDKGPQQTPRSLRSGSGLLSAACEFTFSLAPGGSIAFVVSSPMRDDVTPHAD